ncbi:unnamed protein product [Sphagnum jensenii]|uniref:CCHC-type domain-containing protein n=1 Tax=Sphagnum jensenii TaxID=128206 RepID=A0ABP0X9A3_9BRYO
MASKLGVVLEIEGAESYIKRPVGPMVAVEVQDISKLAGFISIPSMAEGATTTNTIQQKIIYSSLPNQCKKCRQFGHHARACNTNIVRPREGPSQHNPSQGANMGEELATRGVTQGVTHASKPKPPTSSSSDPHTKRGDRMWAEALDARDPPHTLSQPARHAYPHSESLVQFSNHRRSTSNDMRDQEMRESLESPARHKGGAQPEAEQLKEGRLTPNAKLHFEIPELTG